MPLLQLRNRIRTRGDKDGTKANREERTHAKAQRREGLEGLQRMTHFHRATLSCRAVTHRIRFLFVFFATLRLRVRFAWRRPSFLFGRASLLCRPDFSNYNRDAPSREGTGDIAAAGQPHRQWDFCTISTPARY